MDDYIFYTYYILSIICFIPLYFTPSLSIYHQVKDQQEAERKKQTSQEIQQALKEQTVFIKEKQVLPPTVLCLCISLSSTYFLLSVSLFIQ